MSTARIILDPNPHGKYYVAGDTITGKVILNIPKSKTLEEANIRCFSILKYYMAPLDMNDKAKIFDVTIKLLKEPLNLAPGDNTIEFSIQIPMKRKIATMVSGRMGALPLNMIFPDHTVEFKGRFDGILSDEIKALEDLKICPIFPPATFPEKEPQVFTHVQDLSVACRCFSKKIEAQIKIEGIPPCFHYSGKMSFPLKISILPPPGVRPLNFTVSFGVEISIINFLVESQCFFKASQQINSDLLPDAEGWFHQELVAEFDVSKYELISGCGDPWNKLYFWQVGSLYSNGKQGEAVFLVYASPHDSADRLSSEQKDFVAFLENPENGSKEYGKQ